MKSRRAHYLRHNKASRMPRCLVFIGAEWYEDDGGTNGDGRHLVAGEFAASVWRRSARGYRRVVAYRELSANSVRAVVKEAATGRGGAWVYANRMCGILGGSDLFHANNPVVEKVGNWILSEHCTAIYGTVGGRRVTLCDANNYGQGSRGCGLSAVDDLESAEGAVIPLIEMAYLCDFGNWSVSLGGVAWNAYRHKFMKHKILVHNDRDVLALERRSYYGGHVYVGYEGKVPWRATQLDVNGLYAFCMAQEPMPTRLLYSRPRSDPITLLRAFSDGFVVADVTLKTDYLTFPVRINNRAVHATGSYKTTLCGAELYKALTTDCVRASGMYAAYRTSYCFDECIEWFLKLRMDAEDKGQRSLARLAKMLPNSLYGKFAAHDWGWSLDADVPSQQRWGCYWQTHPKTGEKVWCRSVAGCVKVKTTKGEINDSTPIISAAIASRGREHMRSLRNCAGIGNVYYQDTDSLFVNDNGLSRICDRSKLHPTRSGALKLAGTSTDMEIRGVKSYTFNGGLVVSGLQADAREVSPGVYEQEQLEGPSAMLMREPDGRIGIKVAKFSLRRPRRTYQLGPDGFTRPIHYVEE